MDTRKSGTKEVKFFAFKAYIPLTLQPTIVDLIMKSRINITRNKITAA